jgi:hypothetical protein
MKTTLLRVLVLFLVVFTILVLQMPQKILQIAKSQLAVQFEYTAAELNAMKLINDHRVSVGLNALHK